METQVFRMYIGKFPIKRHQRAHWDEMDCYFIHARMDIENIIHDIPFRKILKFIM